MFRCQITCYKRALNFRLKYIYFLLQIISCDVLCIIVFVSRNSALVIFTIRKCNFLRAPTPVGSFSYLALDAIYLFLLFYQHNVFFCFYIVLLMTINTFELNGIEESERAN